MGKKGNDNGDPHRRTQAEWPHPVPRTLYSLGENMHRRSVISEQVCLRDLSAAIELRCDSSLGGTIRQQTKPFIVEIKQTRKPKPATQKPSICGTLDLSSSEDHAVSATVIEPATAERGDQL